MAGLEKTSIRQITECHYGFVEQKSDGIILVKFVAACIL